MNGQIRRGFTVIFAAAVVIAGMPFHAAAAEKTEPLTGYEQPTVTYAEKKSGAFRTFGKGLQASSERKASSAAVEKWSGYSSDYFYNQMTAGEQKLYDKLTEAATAAMESTETISVISASYETKDLTDEQRRNVVRIWEETEQQFFFIKGSSTTSRSGLEEKRIAIDVMPEYQDGNAEAGIRKPASAFWL